MPTYRVIYENDIEADSPRKAAEQAWEQLRDPEALAPIFDVIPWRLEEDEEVGPRLAVEALRLREEEFERIDLEPQPCD